jgi:hypothetical protein
MDPGEYALHVVEGPVVDRADEVDEGARTAELPQPGVPPVAEAWPADPLVPPVGRGVAGWAGRVGAVLRRNVAALIVIAALAAAPTHFFAGRLDDTLIAAPALSDLAGGSGLLLLPLMWLAYFAVSALPMLIVLAGVVGVVVPASADGVTPRFGAVWSLVAHRLGPLWVWLTGFGLLAQTLPLLVAADRPAGGLLDWLTVVLVLASTAALTVVGLLGCVVLVEPGRGPRRAIHLLSLARVGGLAGAALLFTVAPRPAALLLGPVAGSAVAVLTSVLWAVAALVTYAQARRAEGPLSSGSLRAELVGRDRF